MIRIEIILKNYMKKKKKIMLNIIERFISSAESFLLEKWDELDFSQSYTDLNGIIIINENDEGKKDKDINQVDHNNKHRRRKYRGRRQNKKD